MMADQFHLQTKQLATKLLKTRKGTNYLVITKLFCLNIWRYAQFFVPLRLNAGWFSLTGQKAAMPIMNYSGIIFIALIIIAVILGILIAIAQNDQHGNGHNPMLD